MFSFRFVRILTLQSKPCPCGAAVAARWRALMLLAAVMLSACDPTMLRPAVSTNPSAEAVVLGPAANEGSTQSIPEPHATESAMQAVPPVASTERTTRSTEKPQDIVPLTRGTGRFINEQLAMKPPGEAVPAGDITINFENADIREVVNFVLGDMLQENYLIHPAVSGTVTLQTSRPLVREALIPTLEHVLSLSGFVLVRGQDGGYLVRPREGALRGTTVPRMTGGGPGMGVRIIPLQYISANEMVKILAPLLTQEGLLRADSVRNLLMLAGTARELEQWQETIDIFDVDWLQGMSVAMFTLRHAEVADVVSELDRFTNASSESPLAGLFHVIPVERLNAILVMTSQPRYLEEAKDWIRRLDRVSDAPSLRLRVYRMKHMKAEEVARLLTEIYGGDFNKPSVRPEASLAPGATPASVSSDNKDKPAQKDAAVASATLAPSDSAESGGLLQGEVRIIADTDNNALLIMASESDYDLLQDALKELDIPRLQVLVDATIVEVQLTDELRYGLQWFFTNSVGDYQGEGILANAANIGRTFPGFNFSLVDSAGQVRAVLDALAEDSKVNVLSAPSVMVLDNQEAVIRVGDQVPIRTTESTSTVTDNPVTVTSIQYRDTGVSLRVTPTVNAGGMVQLEIEQEVTDVSTTNSSGIDSPTLTQRLIQSSVAVQSGETIVLGGLIRENNSRDKSGFPILHEIPGVGALFGSTTTSVRRTELLVLLTPRVAENATESKELTAAFRERMKGLESQVREATARGHKLWQ